MHFPYELVILIRLQPSAFSFSQELIDTFLRTVDDKENIKYRIYSYFQRHPSTAKYPFHGFQKITHYLRIFKVFTYELYSGMIIRIGISEPEPIQNQGSSPELVMEQDDKESQEPEQSIEEVSVSKADAPAYDLHPDTVVSIGMEEYEMGVPCPRSSLVMWY